MSLVATSGTPDEAPGVVVHLDEPEPSKHDSVLTNIANSPAELRDATRIELVVHGGGLGVALADGPSAPRLRELLERGVEVAACTDTMRVEPSGLVAGVRVVATGAAEPVRRQRGGWSYLRP
ncbi:MAG: hypothetical protein NVS3B12_09480 [Acidimicrobiales bacterium]